MNIDDEVKLIISILSHPAGYDIDLDGTLCIRPIYEHSPPQEWEVDWEEYINDPAAGGWIGSTIHHKTFTDIEEAAKFFVFLRHQRELGLDFEAEAIRISK